MAKVLSFTPEWLSRPSPGFDFFAAPANTASNKQPSVTLNQRLAHRGSEVFYAVGSELRWGDLHLFEAAASDESFEQGSRLLKIPVSQAITQLSVSPDGSFIAVSTKHTCHVCVLPGPSHLRSGDFSTLRLRSFQIGPTAHVLEQAPLATTLWHPLSPPGTQCLVTVTKDACLRLWELDITNRYSFDQPTVAIDLKKLANATSVSADFGASKFGANRSFSPDEVEMEIAAACFGGSGWQDEHGWSSMTLWFAMTEGDVYALCPFLPSRFILPSTALPSLSTGVIAQEQLLAADKDATETEKSKYSTQAAWLTDLDNQEPLLISSVGEINAIEVYTRPAKQGAIAKLQGPFLLNSDLTNGSVSDVLVIAPMLDDNFLYGDQDEDLQEEGAKGVSVSILCLATTSGQVYVCLNLEDVSAEWLPTKRNRAITFDDEEDKELLVYQTTKLPSAGSSSTNWPTFSYLPTDRYEILITANSGIFSLNFNPWVYSLEDELNDASASGNEFRLKTLLESSPTIVRALLPADTDGFSDPAASIALTDATIGHMILTATNSGPHAIAIDLPQIASNPYEPHLLALPVAEPRGSYQPPTVFFEQSELGKKMAQKRTNPVVKAELAQQIRSRPETLQLLTDAHRVLSNETHHLGLAAAELFRRCERMCAELHNQLQKVDEISQKVNSIVVDEDDEEEDVDEQDNQANAAVEARLMHIESDTLHINTRIDALRKKMLRLGGQELNAKEKAYAEEVHLLSTQLGVRVDNPTTPGALLKMPDHDDEKTQVGSLTERLTDALSLKDQLVDTAENITTQLDTKTTNAKKSRSADSEYKKQKLANVMELLERETALIEAVTARLGRLGEC